MDNAGSYFWIAVGVVQWTVAIAAVIGTLALFTWVVVMVVKKDR
jgi:hypothetical protein